MYRGSTFQNHKHYIPKGIRSKEILRFVEDYLEVIRTLINNYRKIVKLSNFDQMSNF